MFSQNSDEKLPLHYKKMKEIRAQWQTNPKTAIKADGNDYKKILARAMQIKDLYKETHYVFFHGIPADSIPNVYLLNALVKKDGIPKSRFFKHARLPVEISQKVLEELILHVQEIMGDVRDLDSVVQRVMLSADVYHKNEEDEDSAFYFLRNNISITSPHKVLHEILLNYEFKTPITRKLVLELVHRYDDPEFKSLIGLLPESIIKKLSDEGRMLEKSMTKLSESLQRYGSLWRKDRPDYCSISSKAIINANCGSLLVFCIPKELLNKAQKPEHIAYRSHRLGKKCDCDCLKKRSDIEMLQDLQNDRLDPTTACKIHNYVAPQYRLMTPSLTPQNGVLAFLVTPYTKVQRKEIKEEVNCLLTLYFDAKKRKMEKENEKEDLNRVLNDPMFRSRL